MCVLMKTLIFMFYYKNKVWKKKISRIHKLVDINSKDNIKPVAA